jgi:predicted transposase/invertase (TIGR01784 family)
MTSRPHDALFRGVFSQHDLAVNELRGLLPSSIVQALDLASLQVVPGTFIDARLKERQSDLLYRIHFKESDLPALIYVLQEHQSRADPEMPFRLLRYLVRIWDGFRKDHPRGALPPIVPIVVSHSTRGWRVPESFEWMVDFQGLQQALLPYTPKFSYIVLDLARISDEELNARFETFIALIFRALRDVRELGGIAFVLRELATLRDVGRSHRKEGLHMLYRYLLLCSKPTEEARIIKLVSDNEPTESEGIMYSAAQRLIDEGMEKGIQKGIAKGRLEGQVALLRRQLQLKFPRAPKSAFSRLDSAGASELEVWSERIVTATTLEEVFAQ